jgi:hypothetical protein
MLVGGIRIISHRDLWETIQKERQGQMSIYVLLFILDMRFESPVVWAQQSFEKESVPTEHS